MNRQDVIEKLLEEVVRGKTPLRVLEMHTQGVQDFLEQETDMVEGLMSFYPDLEEEDAVIFDAIMDQYYEDDSYSLTMALHDLLASGSSKFMNNRIGNLIKRNNFRL